ncbi:hypothetical protein ACIP6X_02165 [Streptomyces coeruleorubidus]|uniref:hypothetical protein n=1 Tax=Streptomyces coeruleorubidus TaxID=116188 RepID=UPI00382F2932
MTAPAEPGTEVQAAIDQLTAREAELAAELSFEREQRFELRTARNFADSDAAGYIDRTGLER